MNEVFANFRWDHRGHWNWVCGKNLLPSFCSGLPGMADGAALDRLRSRSHLRHLALASRAAGLRPGSPLPLYPRLLLNRQLTTWAWPLGKDAAGPGLELCRLIIHSFSIHVFSTCVPGTVLQTWQ